ncbi:unnamed protein product, partial [Cyprideis torosa]
MKGPEMTSPEEKERDDLRFHPTHMARSCRTLTSLDDDGECPTTTGDSGDGNAASTLPEDLRPDYISRVSASSVYVDLWLRVVMAVSPSLKVFFLTLCSAVVLCVPTVDPLEELKRRSATGPVDWTDGRTGYVAETRTGSSSPCGPNFECIDEFECEKDYMDDFQDLLPKLGIQKNSSLTECIVGSGVKGVCCKVIPPSQECGENEVCELDKCPVQREQEISDLRETRKVG